MASECAVCLDDIATDQPARLVPGCNHAFHVECADTWLSKHPLCPLCRAKLDPTLISSSETLRHCTVSHLSYAAPKESVIRRNKRFE
ncbi:E3 ubiquitin-protein [Vigna angularis]|uniref:E3 ubiquitin-protein n=1 Tax=Phaseolus angularis TaxID=3914 RepID=A0A8T0K3F2_PHAAN|nr:E3 ubiquitin-protein [Vigna angularis]